MPRQSESILAAIKQAIDIVTLVGEYLPLHRQGGKFKALCPFHDDHNPSLELNSERRSFKCWSCGAGGDVIDFVKDFERVEFPEAVRMLAERAGITLERTEAQASTAGPSKTDLLDVCAWAEGVFAEALNRSEEARSYLASRGISGESIARFRLGFAPDARDWLSTRAVRAGFGTEILEVAGLIARKPETNLTRDRFRGRVIFPIHDTKGRPIAFGGRILPSVEKKFAENDQRVAKYLNSPETPLFQKRRTLYAAHLARDPVRKAKWVAVVEGYTDVIAAHQAGIPTVVGTLGTALGGDHVQGLRTLGADRVVLIFDGDEAGQKAADRSLELFLAHEVELRVLTLPDDLDPADFLNSQGSEAFLAMVDQAVDPLRFVLDRAAQRFDFASPEGARQAAQWVLSILAKVPSSDRSGLGFKVDVAIDTLSHRLGIPVAKLKQQLRREQTPRRSASVGEPRGAAEVSEEPPIRLQDLNPIDRELVEIALNEPLAVGVLSRRLAADSLKDAPLRSILQACYDLQSEGLAPESSRVLLRLTDREKALAVGLLMPSDPQPFTDRVRPASWSDRLEGILLCLVRREWEERKPRPRGRVARKRPNFEPGRPPGVACGILEASEQAAGS